MNSQDDEPSTEKSKKPPLKLFAIISALGLSILCIVGVVVTCNVSAGGYSIEEVVLTDNLDKNGKPIGSKDRFRPSDPIVAWVSTRGAEGIIGMRWFYEDEMIFERFGKTQGNQIYTYIQSNKTSVLPEGKYRVEITTGGTPHETLYFSIKQYRPEVLPAQPTPEGHQKIEASAFVEVPFAFDEIWTIDGEEWEINEVKIVFLGDETEFISIVAMTDADIPNLTENQSFALAKPIATYAVKNGYLDMARNLTIDGKSYDLNKEIYVNLVSSRSNNLSFGTKEKAVYRVGFNIADLLVPAS